MQKTLTQILGELDWMKILKNAINSRPSSWSDKPVLEWRNAGDTVFCALVNELRERGYGSYSLLNSKRH
jgi:hypothetical protein